MTRKKQAPETSKAKSVFDDIKDYMEYSNQKHLFDALHIASQDFEKRAEIVEYPSLLHFFFAYKDGSLLSMDTTGAIRTYTDEDEWKSNEYSEEFRMWNFQ